MVAGVNKLNRAAHELEGANRNSVNQTTEPWATAAAAVAAEDDDVRLLRV